MSKSNLPTESTLFKFQMLDNAHTIHVLPSETTVVALARYFGVDTHRIELHWLDDEQQALKVPCVVIRRTLNEIARVVAMDPGNYNDNFQNLNTEEISVENSHAHDSDEMLALAKRRRIIYGEPLASDMAEIGVHVCGIDGCRRAFDGRIDLKQHRYRMHVSEDKRPPFECPHCGDLFGAANGLRFHVLDVHTQTEKFKCRHCGKGFTRPGSVHIHIKKMHKDLPAR